MSTVCLLHVLSLKPDILLKAVGPRVRARFVHQDALPQMRHTCDTLLARRVTARRRFLKQTVSPRPQPRRRDYTVYDFDGIFFKHKNNWFGNFVLPGSVCNRLHPSFEMVNSTEHELGPIIYLAFSAQTDRTRNILKQVGFFLIGQNMVFSLKCFFFKSVPRLFCGVQNRESVTIRKRKLCNVTLTEQEEILFIP